ncbi:cbb3-type cytochrome c oxidase subunit I, partial [Bacillus cereus group sp. N15]|uniref:cbb3-type cytochrome c oxidase subunit I n=1 Tax=Bacillus cereus group sp. N15 TaxID=2794588 RepID=UPI0018F5A315
IFALRVIPLALALMRFERLFDAHFFTRASGGMPMLWSNLFWVWCHPVVYFVILPGFVFFSEIISSFSGIRLFGFSAMV